MNEIQKQPTSCNDSTMTIINKYGSLADFLVTFNPSRQSTYCQKADRCYFGSAPTLAEIKKAYGDNAPTMFVLAQAYNLQEYAGSKDKMTSEQLEELSMLIANEYFYLKTTEIMMFFHRFKLRKYGQFYGVVDPLVIMGALRTFVQERNDILFHHESEEEDKKRKESKAIAVTREQYQQMLIEGKAIVPSQLPTS